MTGTLLAPRRVVVGVDGSRAARNALLWAAREARIRHAQLVITHVDPPSPDAVGLYGQPVGSEAILESSAAAASRREPNVVVATMLMSGAITDELIRLTSTASLLVVGVDSQRPRSSHGMLGPVEDRLVVHASCPVVTVRHPPPVVPHSDPNVVVCWTDDEAGQATLSAAVEEAVAHDSSLTVVVGSPAHQRREVQREWDPRSNAVDTRMVDEAVTRVGRRHPGLLIKTVQERGDLIGALLARAESSELLVVGSPHEEDRWSIRLGPIVGTLMREAPCPVMLVGPSTVHASVDVDRSTAASS